MFYPYLPATLVTPNQVNYPRVAMVADPGQAHPDPDSTLEKKSESDHQEKPDLILFITDPDPNFFGTRIRNPDQACH